LLTIHSLREGWAKEERFTFPVSRKGRGEYKERNESYSLLYRSTNKATYLLLTCFLCSCCFLRGFFERTAIKQQEDSRRIRRNHEERLTQSPQNANTNKKGLALLVFSATGIAVVEQYLFIKLVHHLLVKNTNNGRLNSLSYAEG